MSHSLSFLLTALHAPSSADALSTALTEWGGERGAIVVVSHDRSFCAKIAFTHVATVSNGKLTIEQRSARPSDWVIDEMSDATSKSVGGEHGFEVMTTSKEVDDKVRKRAYNAPKRITKLETMIEDVEGKISALDKDMMANGSDVGKLVELSKDKEALELKVLEYMHG